MSVQQLCFFKFSRPLVELLGEKFFKEAPSAPGVYLFFGDRGRVLYVGQSKNLRIRLSYYKNAQPEREPRRIIRLVHQTKTVELRTCASASEARAREIELIQEHRPRFNVQNALSRTYSFFGLRAEQDRLILRLSLEQIERPNESFIGAFKNRSLCRRAFFALSRTLWTLRHKITSIYDFPMWLLDRSKLNEIELSNQLVNVEEMVRFLTGHSNDLLRHTAALVEAQTDPFLKVLFESDRVLLEEFFVLAARMRELREASGAEGVLPQQQIDRVALTRSIVSSHDQETPTA